MITNQTRLGLKALTIANYKAFGTTQTINFAECNPGVVGSGLTVIVGPNNAGKSTVIGVVENLLSNNGTFTAGLDDRRKDGFVQIKLTGEFVEPPSTTGIFDITVAGRENAAHLQKTGNWPAVGAPFLERVSRAGIFIGSRRTWSDTFYAQSRVDRFEYEVAMRHQRRTNVNQVDLQFGPLLVEVETNPAQKKVFSEILKSLDPSISDWSIDYTNNQDFISFKSVAGNVHRIGLVGDGVQNMFRIAYAIYRFSDGGLLVLDEPELSLHPQAQKRLYEAVRGLTSRGQVIVATHSPYFVSWPDIQAGAKIYRTNLVQGNGTKLTTPSADTVARVKGVTSDKKNRKLYDVVAKEIFFSMGVVFVEGQEDAHIIATYLDENSRRPLEIFGYGSGGAPHMNSWLQLAVELGIKAAAIFDGDEAGSKAYDDALSKWGASCFLMKLPTPDIRDKLSDDRKNIVKAGIFGEDWKIKREYKDYWDKKLAQIEQFLAG